MLWDLIFSQCCWDIVLCHWVLSGCLTFQRTRALWSFRTSGTFDPATWHNLAGFLMINSSTTTFTSRVTFRKVNQFIILFNMILPVAYHTSDAWLFGLCCVTGVLVRRLSVAVPVGSNHGLVIVAWRWGLILSSKCSVLYTVYLLLLLFILKHHVVDEVHKIDR